MTKTETVNAREALAIKRVIEPMIGAEAAARTVATINDRAYTRETSIMGKPGSLALFLGPPAAHHRLNQTGHRAVLFLGAYDEQ
jgi:hypothetical protein